MLHFFAEPKVASIDFLLFLLLTKILFAQNESNRISISDAVELSLTYNLEMQNANKELEKAYKEKWKTISIGLPEITSSFVYQNYSCDCGHDHALLHEP